MPENAFKFMYLILKMTLSVTNSAMDGSRVVFNLILLKWKQY